jgi:hypothetical protein
VEYERNEKNFVWEGVGVKKEEKLAKSLMNRNNKAFKKHG